MDLSKLSHAEKDALILSLLATIEELKATVSALEAKLSANSGNSNRPPSSDGLSKGSPKPRSLRGKSGKKSGGQPGHPGKHLAWSENPNQIIIHATPSRCDACQSSLPEPRLGVARQVVDLPEINAVVTEHRVLETQCSCGKLHRGAFPNGINAPVQYGPKAQALAVYLTQQHMLPVERTASLMNDVFGLSFSEGSVVQAVADAAEILAPTVAVIAEAVAASPVAHADETGMRVESKLHWMHTAATPWLTWIGVHRKRGHEAMTELGVLPNFRGILVHDGLESYRHFDCIHALCNAHHLRELKAIEELGQSWAVRMSTLLQTACHEVNERSDARLSQRRLTRYRRRYRVLLRVGERMNPLRPSSGKRGRTKQNFAANLLRRLREHEDDVWRFASDSQAPFTNNLAEQAIRMPKVKQKVSGGFRTKQGAIRFCVIRSYLETLRKQGCHVIDALNQAFSGAILQPRFV